jgi:cytochrome b561
MNKPKAPVGTESKFQGSFLMLHIYAAALAVVAVVMHLAAAYYHARRWRNAVNETGVVVVPFRARKQSLRQRIA